MSAATVPDPRPAGAGTRWRIGSQVAAAALLAGAAALLFAWLAERPGLRFRADLSADRANTLSEATRAALRELREPVTADVFFRPEPGSAGAVLAEAQSRGRRVLALLRDVSGGRVEIRDHDLSRQSGIEAARARLAEFGLRDVDPGGILVIAMGKRHATLHVNGDLADIDPGDPRGEQGIPRPARLVFLRAEEALVGALLKVGLEDSFQVLFSSGHGERGLEDTGLAGLSELRRSLEGNGFTVDRWSSRDAARIPDTCAVLAVVGPEQPFTPEEASAIEEFVESGGRLVCAPGRSLARGAGASGEDVERSLPSLLLRFGIRVHTEGVVAEPRATTSGPIYGSPQCPDVVVTSQGLAAQSPVTEALKRAGRYVLMPFSMSLERSPPPPGASILTLLTTEDDAWRDLPDAATPTGHDWLHTPEEARGPFALGMTALFRPPRMATARSIGAKTALPETRILCLGSADAFANASAEVNRDFLSNGFDWVVAREYRVHVQPYSRASRRLDVTSGRALSNVTWICVLLLPGACLLLGFLTAWRRRR